MLQKNEFIVDQKKPNPRIIQFQNKNVESYDQSNWNAVLLYNYLAHIINDQFNVGFVSGNTKPENRKAIQSEEKGLRFVAKIVEDAYAKKMGKKKLHDFLEKSVNDLHRYFRALEFYVFLRRIVFEQDNYFATSKDNIVHSTRSIPYISPVPKNHDEHGNGLWSRNPSVSLWNGDKYISAYRFYFVIEGEKIKKYQITFKKDKKKRHDILLNDYYEITKILN